MFKEGVPHKVSVPIMVDASASSLNQFLEKILPPQKREKALALQSSSFKRGVFCKPRGENPF